MKRTFLPALLLPIFALSAFADASQPTNTITAQSTVAELMNPYVRTFDLKQLGAFVNKLKQMPSLPIVHWEQTLPPTDTKPIPDKAQTIFAQIQMATFGKETSFKLVPSDLNGPAQCLAEQQEIATSPDFMNYYLRQGAEGEKAVTFILAHELSHYVHELYIQKFSTNGLSLSGLPSRRLFPASMQLQYGGEEDAVTLAQRFVISFGPQASSHAEVDALAFIIMKKMGFSADDILKAQELALDVSPALEVSNPFPVERRISFTSTLTLALTLGSSDPRSQIANSVATIEPLVRVKSSIATAGLNP